MTFDTNIDKESVDSNVLVCEIYQIRKDRKEIIVNTKHYKIHHCLIIDVSYQFDPPVCKYSLSIASFRLFSCQAFGFATEGFGPAVARCHRQCRRSTRLLQIVEKWIWVETKTKKWIKIHLHGRLLHFSWVTFQWIRMLKRILLPWAIAKRNPTFFRPKWFQGISWKKLYEEWKWNIYYIG